MRSLLIESTESLKKADVKFKSMHQQYKDNLERDARRKACVTHRSRRRASGDRRPSAPDQEQGGHHSPTQLQVDCYRGRQDVRGIHQRASREAGNRVGSGKSIERGVGQ